MARSGVWCFSAGSRRAAAAAGGREPVFVRALPAVHDFHDTQVLARAMNIIYLHGFASSPASSKARFFAGRFRERGIPVSVPDLADGDFEHLTITRQLQVIAREAKGLPVTLIGSSLGGYLAALYAARHQEVERVVLLAPAFGFGRLWSASLGQAALAEWERTGIRQVWHYGDGRERPLAYDLIRDASDFEDFPRIHQPALVVHGVRDEVVPARLSSEFGRLSRLAKVVLLDSGHELTDVLEPLWCEVAAFLGV
jgi:pimeloyl-ACP methyl ester carboxylesterase